MADGVEQVTAAVRRVFSREDIPTLSHTVNTRWVEVSEWGGKSVCMWGTTLGDRLRIEGDAALAEGDFNLAALRRQIATVIECARDGDGPEANRIFNRVDDWGWLDGQPASVLDPLIAVVADMDASGTATGVITQAFGIPELERRLSTLESCLSYIASASGSCTECPQNSLPTCPRASSTSLSPPTES